MNDIRDFHIPPELEEALDNFAQAITEFANVVSAAYIKAFEPFSISLKKFKANSPRWQDEHIRDYIQRKPSALDNPDVRWEYQKHIWGTPYRLLKRLRHGND